MPLLLWRWWTEAKVLSIAVTVALPVQSSVSPGILPQAVGRQDSTSCASTSCYSGPFYMPSAGESEGAGERRRERKKGGTTLGTPFASDPSPYYPPDCKFETKQQQGLISCGFALCAYFVYWKDHYTGWTMCAHTLLSVAHFTICRQRPTVIQTLCQFHRNESQRLQHELMYTETTWYTWLHSLKGCKPHTVIWCALIWGFCEIIYDNVLKCIQLKVSTLRLGYG